MYPESDLAAERRRADTSVGGVDYKAERCCVGSWEHVKISTEEGARSIGRPIGNYRTLNTPRLDLLDLDGIEDAKNEIACALCSVFDALRVFPSRILVVGLGNEALAPDAVGPLTASKVRATMHISELDPSMFSALECSEIAVIKTGVFGQSGLDSAFVIKGVCDLVKPSAVIAVDSLAAGSEKRLGTTVQISDTGIFPGTGLGFGRRAVNRELLGVPVIAIGVPTVMDSRILGGTDDGLFVCPKDINAVVDAAAEIIAGGINQAFGLDAPF